MPCGYHYAHHRYGPPWAHACPYCGVPHPPAYGPQWQPPMGMGPGYGWGYAPGWMRHGPAHAWPAPPRPLTDEEIRDAANDYLRADPRIPPQAQIQVEVREGVVTLTGSAPDKWTKHAAGEVALGLPGVVDVQNNLQIARPGRERAKGGANP